MGSLTETELSYLSRQEINLPPMQAKIIARNRMLIPKKIDDPVTELETDEPMPTLSDEEQVDIEAFPSEKRKRVLVRRLDPYNPEKTFVNFGKYMSKNYPIDWKEIALPEGWDGEAVTTFLDESNKKRKAKNCLLPYALKVFKAAKEQWPNWCFAVDSLILLGKSTDLVPPKPTGKISPQPVLKEEPVELSDDSEEAIAPPPKKRKKVSDAGVSSNSKTPALSGHFKNGEKLLLGSTPAVIRLESDTSAGTNWAEKAVKSIEVSYSDPAVHIFMGYLRTKSLEARIMKNTPEGRGVAIPEYLTNFLSVPQMVYATRALTKSMNEPKIVFDQNGACLTWKNGVHL